MKPKCKVSFVLSMSQPSTCFWFLPRIFRFLLCLSYSLLNGIYPQARHDGVAWKDSKFPGDKKRAVRARNRERWCFGAACCQKRGDWSWMKQALAMVGWRETAGKGRCCWKCLADRKDNPFTDGCLNACWRSTKLTTLEYLTEAIANQDYIASIFEWPGFILDFIHADFWRPQRRWDLPARPVKMKTTQS